MSRNIWDIPGGIHPADNKAQSLELELGTLPLPRQLVVPLSQHSGMAASPIVKLGDKVLKGQKIADAVGTVSAPTHAPSSGTVIAIDQQQVPHPSGMTAPCITIQTDGNDQWVERTGVTDFHTESPAKLLQCIREAGIAGLGGAGFPTAVKLSAGTNVSTGHKIKTLIINATECEPYITADDMLMRTCPAEVVEGIKILAHILGDPEEILIGIEDNKVQAYNTLEPLLKGTSIELVEFPTKYPSGGEKQLIQILTGQELPNGKLPADIGVICQNVGTTHAIYRAIVEGTPLISRITTVTGEACGTKRNFELLLGTSTNHVLQQCGFEPSQNDRVVMGGPMMGFALPVTEVPVVKTTNCILAPSRTEIPPAPPAQACIRCGACAEVCPASLLPQQLFWHAQAKDHQRLQSHNLFDCIECGACAYACPSHIPLVQYYRAAKGEIRQLAQEKIKADRARERFEFNKLRKERAETEKAAKREARRLAAEQAKAKLSDQNEAATASGQASDVVQAALAKVAAKQVTPEQQQAKLERSVKSAESRLERLQKKLAVGQAESADPKLTPEQVESYKAQIESARLKLNEAQQKLADFTVDNGNSATAAKTALPNRQKLEDTIKRMQQRIAKTRQQLTKVDDPSMVEALQNSLARMEQKLSDTKTKLATAAPARDDLTP